jgi:hypothetical protein
MAGFLSLGTRGFTTMVLITDGGVTPAEGARCPGEVPATAMVTTPAEVLNGSVPAVFAEPLAGTSYPANAVPTTFRHLGSGGEEKGLQHRQSKHPTTSSTHLTQMSAASSVNSSTYIRDESSAPMYSKPNVWRCWMGWIRHLKNDNITDAPVTPISLWATMRASSSSTWSMPSLEGSMFLSGRRTGGYPIFQGVGGHGFRCRTNSFSIQVCWRGICRKDICHACCLS